MNKICLNCGAPIAGPMVLCGRCEKKYTCCDHGHRASKCEACRAEAQISALKAENARLRKALKLLSKDPPMEETPTIESMVGWMQAKAREALKSTGEAAIAAPLPAPTQGETPHVDRALERIAAQHAAAGTDEGQTP